jgi:hypothetical protein
MSRKTPEDCAQCPTLTRCTAHISGGSWPHNKGVDPCVVIIGEKSTKTAIPPPPSTMPRKGEEEAEPGYAQRFSLRDGR